jgi:hypothetical protein
LSGVVASRNNFAREFGAAILPGAFKWYEIPPLTGRGCGNLHNTAYRDRVIYGYVVRRRIL